MANRHDTNQSKPRYQIFISYRRQGGEDSARQIQLSLENSGYQVFLDYDNLHNGNFEEEIKNAIAEAKVFLLIMTAGCFDRCVGNPQDWIVKEVTYAVENNKEIIPVNVNRQHSGMPNGMDDYLVSNITKHTFQEIFTGQPFKTTMADMIETRIAPIIGGSSKSDITQVTFFAEESAHLWVDENDYGQVAKFATKPKDFRPGTYTIKIGTESGKRQSSKLEIDGKADSIICILSSKSIYTNQQSSIISGDESDSSAVPNFIKGYELFLNADYKSAIPYFEKAADQNYINAKIKCAECYFYLWEEDSDNEDYAFVLIKEVCKTNQREALYILADFYEKATAKNRDYDKAYEIYKQISNSGDPDSLYQMARMHFAKTIKHPNFKIAIHLLEKAAKKGHIGAIEKLGEIYNTGYGVPVDRHKAFEYYLRAAELNSVDSQSRVAFCYLNNKKDGEKVTGEDIDSYKKYEYWRDKAAENGDVRCNVMVGINFFYSDIKKAIHHFSIAIEKNSAWAMEELAMLYEDHPELNKVSEAFGLYKKAYELGENCGCDVARYYTFGLAGIEPDYEKAYNLYKEGTKRGDEYGYYGIAYLYENGKYLKKDIGKALQLYEEASARGCPEAMVRLAQIYYEGLYGTLDPVKAYKLYYKLSLMFWRQKKERSETSYMVGYCLQKGIGTKTDTKAAYEWYYRSALWGYDKALLTLGDLYLEGQYVKQNSETARYWYNMAGEAGLPEGYIKLGDLYSMREKESAILKAFDYYRLAIEAGSVIAAEKYIKLAQKNNKGVYLSLLDEKERAYADLLSELQKTSFSADPWPQKALSTLRTSLEISEARALLIQHVMEGKVFSQNENDYLHELQRLSFPLTSNERHLLDIIANRMNLSTERKQFLDSLCNNKLISFIIKDSNETS